MGKLHAVFDVLIVFNKDTVMFIIAIREDNPLTHEQSVSSSKCFTWQTEILQPLADKTTDNIGFLLVILKIRRGKNAFDKCIFIFVLFHLSHQSIHVIPD